MPLQELQPNPDGTGLAVEAEAFFRDVCAKLKTFLGQEAKIETLKVYLGTNEEFFTQFKRRRYMLTRIGFADRTGIVCFINSVDVAIAMAGAMWALPKEQIEQRVRARELDDELRDVYKEISAQLSTMVQKLAAERIPDSTPKFTTEDLPASGVQNDLVDAGRYLMILADVCVGELQPAPLHLFVAERLLPALFPSGRDVLLAPPGMGGLAGEGIIGGLEGRKACDFMVKDYPVIDADKTVGDAHELMTKTGVDSLPIVDEEIRVLRLISRNNVDVMKSVFFDMPGVRERAARVMCVQLSQVNRNQELIYVRDDEPLAKAVSLMAFHRIHSIPVIDSERRFMGMITSFQIMGLIAPPGGSSAPAPQPAKSDFAAA